jgi:hypothetical protein
VAHSERTPRRTTRGKYPRQSVHAVLGRCGWGLVELDDEGPDTDDRSVVSPGDLG